jgi:hypothetical protein
VGDCAWLGLSSSHYLLLFSIFISVTVNHYPRSLEMTNKDWDDAEKSVMTAGGDHNGCNATTCCNAVHRAATRMVAMQQRAVMLCTALQPGECNAVKRVALRCS